MRGGRLQGGSKKWLYGGRAQGATCLAASAAQQQEAGAAAARERQGKPSPSHLAGGLEEAPAAPPLPFAHVTSRGLACRRAHLLPPRSRPARLTRPRLDLCQALGQQQAGGAEVEVWDVQHLGVGGGVGWGGVGCGVWGGGVGWVASISSFGGGEGRSFFGDAVLSRAEQGGARTCKHESCIRHFGMAARAHRPTRQGKHQPRPASRWRK